MLVQAGFLETSSMWKEIVAVFGCGGDLGD